MKFYRGPATDHFDGKHFFNSGTGLRGTGSVLRWLANRKPGPWRKWIDEPLGDAPPKRMTGSVIRVTFVGHSTVLIQMNGMNILCDPIWSMRASPFSWIGPRRHRAPGIRFEDLPPIDLVLQSHDHYDHFDVSTLRRIAGQWRPKFVVPLGVSVRLTRNMIASRDQISEIDWWQSTDVGDNLKITSVPAIHFSGRSLSDRNKTLWCGYVIEGPAGTVCFAGDTAYGSHFGEISHRFPQIRLAFIPIGAYLPEWFMGPVHISPADAVRAHEELGAATSIAIHFGTFSLADDGEDQPVIELRQAVEARKPLNPFFTLVAGEGCNVP
ncbi:MAG TPA: MBL fold metallo-hydrolase [Candidatus Acidoferrales bacterium]|nr:MBL fold metallo-hydrolase [Candidatus Acidoferrales bacterium]